MHDMIEYMNYVIAYLNNVIEYVNDMVEYMNDIIEYVNDMIFAICHSYYIFAPFQQPYHSNNIDRLRCKKNFLKHTL